MKQRARRAFANPQTGPDTDARTPPLQPTIVKPEQAPSIKPFGLDVKVLLSSEATGGAISVLMDTSNLAKARATMSISTRKKYSSSSRAPMT